MSILLGEIASRNDVVRIFQYKNVGLGIIKVLELLGPGVAVIASKLEYTVTTMRFNEDDGFTLIITLFMERFGRESIS